MDKPILRIKNLSKTYKSKSGAKIPALRGVSADIGTGMTFIVGRSGCGKTTLLNLIGGVDEASGGEMYLENGQNIAAMSEKALNVHRNLNVGFIFQEYYLLEDMTVLANVALAEKLQGKDAEKAKIDEILDRLGILSKADKPVYELSGGEKQRVAIARALVKNPSIIVADEPTGALDSVNGEALLTLLKQLSVEKPVIVVSHDLAYAEKFADRIITLSDGQVQSDITRCGDVFKDTPRDDTLAENNPSVAKEPLKSVGFSFRTAFLFGLHGLFKRKLRLAASVLTLVFALGVLGTATAFIGYEPHKLFLNSMYTANDYYVRVEPTWENGTPNERSLINLKEKLSSYSYHFFYTQDMREILSFLYNIDVMNYVAPGKDASWFSNAFEIDEELAGDLHYDLLAGRFPSNSDEIMILEFIFSQYKKYGYMKNGEESSPEIKSVSEYSDMLGEEVGGYTIVGILDTHFDYRRYERYLKNRDNGTRNEISNIHFSVFFKTGYFAEYMDRFGFDAFSGGELVIDAGSDAVPGGGLSIISGDVVSRVKPLYTAKFGKKIAYQKLNPEAPDITEMFPDGIVWKDGAEREELAADEVVVPFEYFLYYTEVYDVFFAKKNEYIIEGKDGREAEKLAKIDVATDLLKSHGEVFDITVGNYTRGVSIAGMYFVDMIEIPPNANEGYFQARAGSGKYETEDYMMYSTMFISEALYGNYETNAVKGMYNCYIVLSGDYSQDKNMFFEVLLGNETDTEYNIHTLRTLSPLASAICYIDDYLREVGFFVGIAAAVLAFFSFVTMFSYFSGTVSDEKRTIGILRTLGAKKSDVFKIYISRACAVALVVAVLSVVFSLILTRLCNNILYNDFLYDITLLSYGIPSVAAIVGLCAVSVFSACAWPIYKITAQPPINAVRYF